MPKVSDNILKVLSSVSSACSAAGRDESEITLVAVSKKQPVSKIISAYEAGHRDFGENYAQELMEKMTDLQEYSDIRWHFIGRCQSNKAHLMRGCALVHGISSPKQIRALVRKAPGVPYLLQVNLSREAEKGGAMLEDVERILTYAQNQGFPAAGLMTIPGQKQDPQAEFERLHDCRGKYAALLDDGRLSMGMSGDFKQAIAAGATHIRVGTAIFGARA